MNKSNTSSLKTKSSNNSPSLNDILVKDKNYRTHIRQRSIGSPLNIELKELKSKESEVNKNEPRMNFKEYDKNNTKTHSKEYEKNKMESDKMHMSCRERKPERHKETDSPLRRSHDYNNGNRYHHHHHNDSKNDNYNRSRSSHRPFNSNAPRDKNHHFHEEEKRGRRELDNYRPYQLTQSHKYQNNPMNKYTRESGTHHTTSSKTTHHAHVPDEQQNYSRHCYARSKSRDRANDNTYYNRIEGDHGRGYSNEGYGNASKTPLRYRSKSVSRVPSEKQNSPLPHASNITKGHDRRSNSERKNHCEPQHSEKFTTPTNEIKSTPNGSTRNSSLINRNAHDARSNVSRRKEECEAKHSQNFTTVSNDSISSHNESLNIINSSLIHPGTHDKRSDVPGGRDDSDILHSQNFTTGSNDSISSHNDSRSSINSSLIIPVTHDTRSDVSGGKADSDALHSQNVRTGSNDSISSYNESRNNVNSSLIHPNTHDVSGGRDESDALHSQNSTTGSNELISTHNESRSSVNSSLIIDTRSDVSDGKVDSEAAHSEELTFVTNELIPMSDLTSSINLSCINLDQNNSSVEPDKENHCESMAHQTSCAVSNVSLTTFNESKNSINSSLSKNSINGIADFSLNNNIFENKSNLPEKGKLDSNYEKFSAVDKKCMSTPVQRFNTINSNHLINTSDSMPNNSSCVSTDSDLHINSTFKGHSTNKSILSNDSKTVTELTSDLNNSCLPPKGMGRGKLLRMLSQSVLSSGTSSKSTSTESLSKVRKDEEKLVKKEQSDHAQQSRTESYDDILKGLEAEIMRSIQGPLDLGSSNHVITDLNDRITNPTNEDRESKATDISNKPAGSNKFFINNEHKDRYYDIEVPKYLKFPLEEGALDALENVDGNKKSEGSPSSEVYEQLLSGAHQHDPLDSSHQEKAVKLEQEIISDYTGVMEEKMITKCGIIHGNIKCQPITNVSQLRLHNHIYANMNWKKIKLLTRSQMNATPALLKRRNVILIGPPNSGKTFAYIIAIMNLLMDQDYYKEIGTGNGPRCVFVTSSSQNANHISQFCSAISGARLTIITTYGGGLETERTGELTNGCEILVTTPKCWLRLLRHKTVTNMFRLCHLVFDDIHVLLDKFLPEVKEILSRTKRMLQLRKPNCSVGLQVALVGEKWSNILESSLKVIDDPVVCITSHMEATLYAKVKPVTYILPSGPAKINKLKGLLEEDRRKSRTVIVCKCAAEVKMLRTALSLSFNDVLVAHEEMSSVLISDVRSNWIKSGSTKVFLVCSDSVLGDIAITNAQHLIHFSLPQNMTYFSERFSTIVTNFHDRLKCPMSAPPDCNVDILVGDTDEQEFPEIVNFMKRLSTPIPQEVMVTVNKINTQREERKLDVSLCEKILLFGSCWKQAKCKNRHVFNKNIDVNNKLSPSGIIKVKLFHVHNPSHYSVRIIATKPNLESEWEYVKSKYLILVAKMGNYFSPRENRISHGRVNVGDMVAVEVEADAIFKRASVIDIVSRDEKLNPSIVKVRLIDEGSVSKKKASELLYLPPELQMFEHQAYDLYLTGLMPVDFDPEWSFASYLRLKKNIDNVLSSNSDLYFIAKVLLPMGTNIIATSFVCCEWLELSKCYVTHFSPKKFILDSGLAVPNDSHVTAVLNLALEAGIISSYPKDMKSLEENNELVEAVQWAHLEQDKFIPVTVVSSVHPSLFYLKITNFSESLSRLEKELTESLNKRKLKVHYLQKDMVCAAKNPVDKMWNRGIVTEILNEKEVEVFFVDYGDIFNISISDLSSLPDGFTSRLPFQAIECSLAGISSIDSGWTPEAIRFFYLLAADEENILKPLHAKVCQVDKDAETTNGHHYKVILIDTTKDPEVCLNKEMVYKGFGNWDSETKTCLTYSFSIPHSDDERDDEVSSDEVAADDSCDDFPTTVKLNLSEELEQLKHNSENSSHFNDFLQSLSAGDFDFEFDPVSVFEPPGQNISTVVSSAEKQLKLTHTQSIESEPNGKCDQSIFESYGLNDTKLEYSKSCDDQRILTHDYKTGLEKVYDNIYYPPVLWSQNTCSIKLKVIVPDITCYSIEYNSSEVCFKAKVKEKYYWFDLELFAPVWPESLEFSPGGMYSEIKLEKFVKGQKWPRCSYLNRKYPWLKADPDNVVQERDRSISTKLITRGSRLEKYKDVYKMLLNKDASEFGIRGPDMDSDSESVENYSTGKFKFYDINEDEDEQ